MNPHTTVLFWGSAPVSLGRLGPLAMPPWSSLVAVVFCVSALLLKHYNAAKLHLTPKPLLLWALLLLLRQHASGAEPHVLP